MSIEKVSNEEKVLDLEWYNRFHELSIEAFSMLDGNPEERLVQKAQFLTNEVENPSLGYPKLENFDFNSQEQALLKADILGEERNVTVKEIYRTKINETIGELRMLQAARDGNDKHFARYSAFVYGYPDVTNTTFMSEIVQEKISRGKTDEKKAAAATLRPVLEKLVPQIPKRKDPLVIVEDSELRVGSIEEAVASFEAALIAVGAVDGWTVVADSDSGITNFRVSQKEKSVYVPVAKVVGMLVQDMQAFIQHEVFGHVQRRINGENSLLKLLATGLDRVEKGEEGVATVHEQMVSGADTFSHPERYFAIALARGDVDGMKRDFRQTFEVLKQYYIAVLKGKKTGPLLEERAADWAWGLSVRVFRGTTCKTPGAVFTKDLNYFVGNKETWALINTDENVTGYFTIGKFDAYNERHIGWLTSLGITDQRLSEILEETKTN
jgi:hypothetical protein